MTEKSNKSNVANKSVHFMKINIVARLLPPSMQMYFGGTNCYVFEFKNEIELELTPELLAGLIGRPERPFGLLGTTRLIKVNDHPCSVVSYDKETNLLTTEGHMKSFDEEHIKTLIKNNWTPLEKGVKHHHVKLPENVFST